MRRAAARLGWDLHRFDLRLVPELRRQMLLERHRINLVIDGGANIGQYATGLRANGYTGRIVSFEPLEEAYGQLAQVAAGDPGWSCRRLALGDVDGTASFTVTRELTSSSLLPAHEGFVAGHPRREPIGSEEIELARLDTIAPQLVGPEDRGLLKLDVEGYELRALRGAEETLERCPLVECEFSLQPIREGAPSVTEIVGHLESAGYRWIGVDPAFVEDDGEIPLADAMFVRR